ncbi:MAG: hypothetical protein PVH11_03145 [Anaerolineae bacterium]|jgi:hypothetical protein
MSNYGRPRRLRIVVSDEDTGEEVASASGVETLVLLVAPDTSQNEEYRRILVGDPEMSVQLLLDIVREVTGRIGQGTVVDPSDILDDQMIVDMTEGLPLN